MSEALPYIGAVVGAYFGGASGAQWGWAIGAGLSAITAPTQKTQGPRLDDLKVTGMAYGQPIPYIQGTCRTAGQMVWASDRREIATTTEQGKGGGAENTTYTYEADYLFLLSSNELDGLLRVWDNGKLVYTADYDATSGSLVASSESPLWRRITFYGGDAAQLPDPTYEAAVGVGYAPAYRNMATVFIEGLQLGQSGQLPNLTFEVGTNLTPSALEDYQDHSGRSVVVAPVSGTSGTVPTPSKWGGAFDGTRSPLNVGPGGSEFVFPFSNFCIQGWAYRTQISATTRTLLTTEGDIGNSGGWSLNTSPSHGLQFYGQVSNSRPFTLNAPVATPFQQWFFFKVVRVGSQVEMWMDGVLMDSVTGVAEAMTVNGAPLGVGKGSAGNNNWSGFLEDIALMTRTEAAGPYVPDAPYLPDQNTLVYLPFFYLPTVQRGSVALRTVVERLCGRAGMPTGTYDASDLDAVPLPVRALAASQIGGTRALLEILGQVYHFQAFCADKIYFIPRAQAVRATIPYADLGAAGPFESTGDPFALRQRNDLEVVAQESITYANAADDYQTDTQNSDRLLTAQASTASSSVPLVLFPSEAKATADARVMDGAIGAWGGSITLPLKYAGLTPGDSVLVQQSDGSQYRLLLGRQTLSARVMAFEMRLEDPTVFTQTGITGEDYNPQTEVVAIPGTFLYMLDVPQLRDADNGVGLYAAARGLGPAWPGARVFESTDALSWNPRVDITESGTLGVTVTTLADWAEGNVFDETNTVDVNVGAGTLSSATRDAVLQDRLTNSILIGDEVLQYCTATLITSGVYRLSRLLRERLGTDRLIAGQPSGSRFVFLGLRGIRRITQDNSALAAPRYFKGASLGRALSTAATQEVTNRGVSVTPLSVVNVRANRDNPDTVITWQRRTRMQTRFLGPLSSSVPLGEAIEAYLIDIYSSGAFTSVVRQLASSTPEVTYTSAQQVADFGTPQTVLYVRIYQLSEIVGRGFVRQAVI